jgi:hypothetical protein
MLISGRPCRNQALLAGMAVEVGMLWIIPRVFHHAERDDDTFQSRLVALVRLQYLSPFLKRNRSPAARLRTAGGRQLRPGAFFAFPVCCGYHLRIRPALLWPALVNYCVCLWRH